ncbi:MAG: ferritin [Anaerolineales bacterium]|nr:ferritin [Anaerolineales bacterium]
MLISPKLAAALNTQIGNELGAYLQYLSIAAHFHTAKLTLLEKLFFEQAAEENAHALKFVHYLLDTQGGLNLPPIAAPQTTFASAEEATRAALNWETEVTGQIKALMDIAVADNDYLSQDFLQWYINEQLEEINKMDRLLEVIRRAGDRNLLMVEAYLAHLEVK